jgi:hypothetical protein
MGQEPETASGLESGEELPRRVSGGKSLKGFRKEEVRIDEKEFVQGEAIKSDRGGPNPLGS